MNYQQDRIRRAVLLIEMESGVQHGYQVDHVDEASITWDPPETLDSWGAQIDWSRPQTGEIRARGILTGMSKMPTDAFSD